MDVVVASNRGPLSFATDASGRLLTTKAGGGLVTAIGPAIEGSGAMWIAGAITDADRIASESGLVEAEGFRLSLLTLDERAYRAYYDVVANSTLWYIHHGLFDAPRRPRIDRHWKEAWASFRSVNYAFAEAIASEASEGAVVLVQDYHLSLVGGRLATMRPDLRTAHFHHTPFSGPDGLRVLPDDAAAELLGGLAGFGACGFHSDRWARAFTETCNAVLGSAPPTFVAPAAVDVEAHHESAASEEGVAAAATLADQVRDLKLIVRVDRIEPSKNILRGFHALDQLLDTRPEWRERVVFGAFIYPSRESLPEYLSYRAEVETLVGYVNRRWATAGWTPVLIHSEDEFASSVAALRRADVMLVNPIRDGLNLVAKEGALVNERNAVLALSREAGVWDELGKWALELNPFDVAATSDALHAALSMDEGERAERATGLREAAARRTPRDWFGDQVAAAR